MDGPADDPLSFCIFAVNLKQANEDTMIVDINNTQQPNGDGGTDAPVGLSAPVLLVRNIVKTCKAMASYEAASAMLLPMVEEVSADPAAFAELRRGIEEVRAFFERRDTP